MSAVAVIDYGAGNLSSVRRIFERVGVEDVQVVRDSEAIGAADRIVLPGVGAAGEALKQLHRRGFVDALEDLVRVKARPFLGICLGMQMLAERLYEFGRHPGLGWIKGDVVLISDIVAGDVRVPHIGWNRVEVNELGVDMFRGVRGKREFYFAHSFALRPSPAEDVVIAATDHGGALPAAVLKDNIFAVQFHPEKSQINGENLIRAFVDWKP